MGVFPPSIVSTLAWLQKLGGVRRGGMVSGYWCVHDTHGALEIAKFSFPKLDFQSVAER